MFDTKRHLPALIGFIFLVWLLNPFIDAILFGSIIAYIFLPLHKGLSSRIGSSRSAITMAAIAFTLIAIPSIYLYGITLQQGLVAYENFQVYCAPFPSCQ